MDFLNFRAIFVIFAPIFALIFNACATESFAVKNAAPHPFVKFSGEKISVSLGKISNKSTFENGVFSDGDVLGAQAKAILKNDLVQSGAFMVFDRENLDALKNEIALQKTDSQFLGAKYVISGAVTGFGRKSTGDIQAFGLLGSGKSQVAYAKVELNVIDARTSEIIFSSKGAGEYELSSREVLGFGGTAGYDATLNDKVLGLAVREAVNNLIVFLRH